MIESGWALRCLHISGKQVIFRLNDRQREYVISLITRASKLDANLLSYYKTITFDKELLFIRLENFSSVELIQAKFRVSEPEEVPKTIDENNPLARDADYYDNPLN